MSSDNMADDNLRNKKVKKKKKKIVTYAEFQTCPYICRAKVLNVYHIGYLKIR